MKHWLVLLLFLASGCRTTRPELEPPPQPENFTLPPESEQRYKNYAIYPRDTREPDYLKKVPTPNLTPTRGPRGIGPGI
jgi:hypothetical protein